MAQNITLLGASYSGVPAVTLPKTGGGTASFTDVTDTTAVASDVAQGKYFYTAAGVKTAGTATSGGAGAVSVVDTLDSHGGIIRTITAIDLSDTTATASDVAAGKYFYAADGTKTEGTYTPSGASKNTQIVQGTTRTTSSTLTAIGAELTVSKTGTYDVYWSAFRSSTSSSYTYGTRLYIDGTAYGTENATWSNHVQNNHLTNVSLTENQKIRVYGRNSRGSSYYIYAPMLTIVET